MALVADILTEAARQCSITPPSGWATATDPTHAEFRYFLREAADDLLNRIDWPAPLGSAAVVTGTGAEDYELPADFKRLMRDKYAVYERFRTRRECVPISTDGEWEYMKELGTAGAYRFFRLQGYEGNFTIGFQRALEPGITVVVSYVSDEWVKNEAARKNAFTDELDVALFPRRLLELGVIWRFRRRRGVDYADAMAEQEALIARMINDRRAARVVRFGAVEARAPWDVPVPDVIPGA